MTPYSYANDNNSVIINSTNLPKDWCNYLWSKDGYIGRFTQAGHGESYHIDAKANLCELNKNETRYLYLRDDDSNLSWNVGEAPLMEPVESFRCEHSIAYTKISSVKNEVKASVLYFVPFNGFHEIWNVEIKNQSDRTKNLSMFSVVDFYLEGFQYPRYHEMFRALNAGFDNALNGVFCKSDHYYAPHDRYNAFLASTEPVFASDAHLKQFTGGTGSFSRPLMLLRGNNCTNSRRTCYDIGAVIQHKISLKPGESKSINIVYGMATSAKEAADITNGLKTPGRVSELLQETSREMYGKYATLSCNTPNERINQLMNNWVKKTGRFLHCR
ncbi:MAG: hypothetical protein HC896_17145 [Bacteroidales bacterium]|nr:hypothetical protein [Bacteroidales bacterium]